MPRISGDYREYRWSFFEHTDSPAGIPPEVVFSAGQLSAVSVGIATLADVDLTVDLLVNGTVEHTTTLTAGTAAVVDPIPTPITVALGDVVSINPTSVPDPTNPGRWGTVSVERSPEYAGDPTA